MRRQPPDLEIRQCECNRDQQRDRRRDGEERLKERDANHDRDERDRYPPNDRFDLPGGKQPRRGEEQPGAEGPDQNRRGQRPQAVKRDRLGHHHQAGRRNGGNEHLQEAPDLVRLRRFVWADGRAFHGLALVAASGRERAGPYSLRAAQ